MSAQLLPLAECFGPTVQGEGPSAGRLAAFVRLGGCNLTCDGCDTPYTWDGRRFDLRAQVTQTPAGDILDRLPDAPLVVLTGGEPVLYRHRRGMEVLLDGLRDRDVEVETNATIDPYPMDTWPNVAFNASPKLCGPMSHDERARRLRSGPLTRYAQLARVKRAVFKVVVDSPGTVMEAVELADTYGVPRGRLWLMPAGTDAQTVLGTARTIVDTVLGVGANLTLRQHVLLWGDERGR